MTRMVSERILQLNRMGRTPFGAGTDGHEAAQVGAAWSIRRGKDWTVPYYRDMGVAFVLGYAARRVPMASRSDRPVLRGPPDPEPVLDRRTAW